MSTPVSTLGIDAGASLCKLAFLNGRLETALLPSNETAAVRDRIERWAPRRVVATGGGAAQLAAEIPSVPLRRVGEVEAWARGAPVLARRDGILLPERYLLVSLGTGTSVLRVGGDEARRIGGCALGGGTLVGLGRLLLGAKSFCEVLALASQGERGEVDLLVGDVYPAGGAPLPPQATAANFGKLASTRREDLARALIGLVGENVGLLCGELSRTHGVECVVYAGSTLTDNPLLQQILGLVASLQGRVAHFLSDAPFCGAVGAAALADA